MKSIIRPTAKKIAAGAMSFMLVAGSAVAPLHEYWSLPATSLTASAESTRYEAEQAAGTFKSYSNSSFSGGQGAYIEKPGNVDFKINVPKDGSYNLTIRNQGAGESKENTILINGSAGGTLKSKKTADDFVLSNVTLKKGENTVTVRAVDVDGGPDWGYVYIDYLEVEEFVPADIGNDPAYNVKKTLCNPNSTVETKKLFSFLCDNYGKKVIAGQQADKGMDDPSFKAIKDKTGKLPALCGFDFMEASPSRKAFGSSYSATDEAIKFSKEGGIVTFCWHWNAPSWALKSTENSSNGWWGGFYTDNVNMSKINVEKWLDGSDVQGKKFLDEEIDAIGAELLKLKANNVPVIFRPLHEASGQWFWWGKIGKDNYIKLYQYMYNRLVDMGVNNVIWVCNSQDSSWYPGDEYVDIVGTDIYANAYDYNPQSFSFNELKNYPGKTKIVSLTENGVLFDIDKAFENGTAWGWFMTWGGSEFYGNSKTSADMWKKVFTSDKVVTLDELPSWDTYPYDETSTDTDTVTFNKKEIYLRPGDSYKLSADTNTGKTVKYKSSNSNITVSSDGTVKANADKSKFYDETAIITAYVDGSNAKDSCVVTFKTLNEDDELDMSIVDAQTGVSADPIELKVGDVKKLKVKCDYYTGPIEWQINKKAEGSCEISADGTFKALKEFKGVKLNAYVPNTYVNTGITINIVKSDDPNPAETTLSVSPTTKSVKAGESFKLTATTNSKNTVSYKSSNDSVCTVDANGNVKALKEGSATITASVDGKTAECKVTVTKADTPSETTLTVSPTTKSVKAGESFKLTATTNSTNTVSYKSSDTSVCTVDANGNVKALKAGSATITASVDGKTAECKVTVIKADTSTPSKPVVKVTAPTKLRMTATASKAARIAWNKVNGAEKYQVLIFKNGKWNVAGTTSSTAFRFANLKPGTTYTYAVKACKDGKISTAAKGKLITRPAKSTAVFAASRSKATVKAAWKKVAGANGYQVQFTSNKNLKKGKVVNVTGNTKTIKLASKKTYYVRVRAYKTFNGKKYVGEWSAAKKIKSK